MDPWITRMAEFRDQWGLRITAYCSFGAHLILAVLARSRRRLGVCPLLPAIVWLAYQIPDVATKYALSHLSLPGTDASSRQQQLIAFWAPFLLLHLGGPDNITAYSLEDSKLSVRKWIECAAQIGVAFTAVYSNISLSGSRVLLAASAIMFILGVIKYTERVVALHLGNFSNIRRRNTKPGQLDSLTSVPEPLKNEQALLLAHNNMFFWEYILVDSAVLMNYVDEKADIKDVPPNHQHSHRLRTKIYSMGSRSISKVVEMELSLIYDILYTKATVIHTRVVGYLIRLISPVATAVALSLFCFYPKYDLKRVDVVFTYIMLATTFLLDVVWLVRALGSSWSYAYLRTLPCEGLQHLFLCSGTWCWFHRVARSLDPCRLLLDKDPVSYRRWSGVTGQYNLLHECTRASCSIPNPLTWLLEKAGFDILIEYPYLRGFFNGDVREMVLERIKQRLPPPLLDPDNKDCYTMKEITTLRGKKAVDRFMKYLEDLWKKGKEEKLEMELRFGREFQEDILAWHIGTCVFIRCFDERIVLEPKEHKLIKAIKLVSEHLMFLVAMRHDMLPGLVVQTLPEEIKKYLDIFQKESFFEGRPSEVNLAENLHKTNFNLSNTYLIRDEDERRLIADGTELGIQLLKYHQWYMTELLELVFDVWVEKLMYAGIRCSREAHAKQLSRGGDLITVVWIIIEHAGTFKIGEKSGKPKKEEEEKKKGEKKDGGYGPPPGPTMGLSYGDEYPPMLGAPPMPDPRPPPMPFYMPPTDKLPKVPRRRPRFHVILNEQLREQLRRKSRYVILYPE